jgi:hypothetical protein
MAKSKKTHSGTHTNKLLNPCSIIGSALFTLNLVCKILIDKINWS